MIVAQISDPHLAFDPGQEGGAAAGEEALRRAVAHLSQIPTTPDVVVVTGDCAHHGSAPEYARLREVLGGLRAPAYVIPGNHDDRARMLDAFGAQGVEPLTGFVQYVVEGWPVRLIALDTNVPGRDEGRLGDERLGWLEERLSEDRERPALLFLHHPPFRTGLRVFDDIGLMDTAELGAIVARHPQVKLIAAGHLHSTITRPFHGAVAVTCGATTSQWLPEFQRPVGLAVDAEPPVCLLHVWSGDTGLLTYSSTIVGQHNPVTLLHDGQRWL